MTSESEYTLDDDTPIKYLLLGDISTNKIITEFSAANTQSKSKKEINQIFKKLIKYPNKKIDEHNKITSKSENYYFTFSNRSLLYIVLANNQYPEKYVFDLIKNINEEEIPSMINDETRELNPSGRQALKQLIDAYQNPNNLDKSLETQKTVESIKIDMSQNLSQMSINAEDTKELDHQTEMLQLETKDNKNNVEEIRTIIWWKNVKLLTIIGVLILVIIAVVIFIVI